MGVRALKVSAIEPLPLTDEDIKAAAWLKTSIEALTERHPTWSRSAYTTRQTIHRVFSNGVAKAEMENHAPAWSDPQKLAQRTFEVILAYRREIQGPVDLIWRVEPEMIRRDHGVECYVRLSFEPSLIRVAGGVWVEQRLTEGL